MVEPILTLRLIKVSLMILGSVIASLALRGYKRNGSRALLLLSMGFVLITSGSFVAGLLFEFMGFGLLEVFQVEGIMQLAGFLSIIYSIYGRLH